VTLPSYHELGASLRSITETLAHELAHSSPVAPQWSPTEWRIARAVAAMHGVSPLLARNLRWDGPPDWRRFLEDQRAHTEARHVRIQELLDRLDEGARRAGLAWLGLKGTALYALGLYRPGERPMGDVDLLVHEADVPSATRVLGGLGFRETLVTWKHREFEVADPGPPAGFGENSRNALKIDLHTRISELLPRQATDITGYIYPRRPGPGLDHYPSTPALMMHLLLHAAGAMALESLRVLHLHDVSLLCARMTRADWHGLLAGADGADGAAGADGADGAAADEPNLWWAFPPLQLTDRYYQCVPPWVLLRLARDRPWLLRSLAERRTVTDVSMSRLGVSAFPGIAWAQGPRDMLGYARRRVVPGAAVIALRKKYATSEPPLAASDWIQLSQTRRMLRWLTSRTGRPETLYAVGVALGQSE
jgi:hypothetical protein